MVEITYLSIGLDLLKGSVTGAYGNSLTSLLRNGVSRINIYNMRTKRDNRKRFLNKLKDIYKKNVT